MPLYPHSKKEARHMPRVRLRHVWCCPRGLRSRLVLLVLVTLLPLEIFAVTLLLLFAHEARRTTERGMRETAQALALAIDREVGEVRAALGVLAVSPLLAA